MPRRSTRAKPVPTRPVPTEPVPTKPVPTEPVPTKSTKRKSDMKNAAGSSKNPGRGGKKNSGQVIDLTEVPDSEEVGRPKKKAKAHDGEMNGTGPGGVGVDTVDTGVEPAVGTSTHRSLPTSPAELLSHPSQHVRKERHETLPLHPSQHVRKELPEGDEYDDEASENEGDGDGDDDDRYEYVDSDDEIDDEGWPSSWRYEPYAWSFFEVYKNKHGRLDADGLDRILSFCDCGIDHADAKLIFLLRDRKDWKENVVKKGETWKGCTKDSWMHHIDEHTYTGGSSSPCWFDEWFFNNWELENSMIGNLEYIEFVFDLIRYKKEEVDVGTCIDRWFGEEGIIFREGGFGEGEIDAEDEEVASCLTCFLEGEDPRRPVDRETWNELPGLMSRLRDLLRMAPERDRETDEEEGEEGNASGARKNKDHEADKGQGKESDEYDVSDDETPKPLSPKDSYSPRIARKVLTARTPLGTEFVEWYKEYQGGWLFDEAESSKKVSRRARLLLEPEKVKRSRAS